MRADHILAASRREPSIIAASIAANLFALAIPISMIQIYDRIIPNNATQTLVALGFMVLTAILAELVLRSARQHLLSLAGERFETYAYTRLFGHLMNEAPATGTQRSIGRTYNQIGAVERLRALHSGTTATAILDLPFAFLFLGVVLLISPFAALAVATLLCVCFLVLRRSRKRVLVLQTERREIEAQRHSFLSDVLRGMEAVRSLRIDGFMQRRYERLLPRSGAKSAELAMAVQLGQGFTAAVGTLAPLFICCVGAFLVINDQMSIGSLAAIVLLTGRIVQPVLHVEAYLAGAENVRSARTDLSDLFDIAPPPTGDTQLPGVEALRLDAVTSVPEPSTGIAFCDVSLDLARGDCIEVTASSRAACSSFLRLLADEVQIAQGRYLLNDQDHDGFVLTDRREQVRLLARDNRLLEGTLLENLTMFQPARFRDRAIELTQSIGMDGFIAQSMEGYALHVGGHTQDRLPKSFADAAMIVAGLSSDPDVILFDEANSALDIETDKRLLKLLREIKSKCILVLVSSRPSFQALAERRLDLDPYLLAPSPAEGSAGSASHDTGRV